MKLHTRLVTCAYTFVLILLCRCLFYFCAYTFVSLLIWPNMLGNLWPSCVVLEITSKVHGRKYREEQGVLYSNRKTGCKAWLYSCSACPCLGSQSRGWCGAYPWWVSFCLFMFSSLIQATKFWLRYQIPKIVDF